MGKIKNWMHRMSTHPRATWAMSAFSFAESSFSPVPPDPMLVAMMLANPKRSWFLATLCTVASVLGGVLGYAIGYFLFESIGMYIINLYKLQNSYATFKEWFNDYGFWIIVIKGLTPIPYKLVTITCGAIKLNLVTFVVSSLISRGMRYFFEAFVIWKYGEFITARLSRYAMPILLVTIALTILGFIIVGYLA